MCKVNKFHSNLQQARSDHPKLIFCSNGYKKHTTQKPQTPQKVTLNKKAQANAFYA